MEDIKVTVICAAYNHEKYIRKTLTGFIQQQTSFDFEVIVHDDASTDSTAEIIREFAENYPSIIKPIYQKENQFSKKLKKGIIGNYIFSKIRGGYIAFCEGDDYWCDDSKLQLQYDVMENNPSVSLCVHQIQCINEDGSFSPEVYPSNSYGIDSNSGIISKEKVLNALFLTGGDYPFQTSSYMIKREVFEEIDKYLDKYDYGFNDMLILWMSMSMGDYYYINKIMSCYRVFSFESATSKIFLTNDINKKIDYRESLLSRKKDFDDYTNFQYHDYLVKAMFKNIIPLFSDDVFYTKKIIKRENFSKRVIKEELNNLPDFYKKKYYYCYYFPYLMSLYFRMKRNKGKQNG